MVYSDQRIIGTEALAAQRRISPHPSFKIKQKYSKMFGFVRARISLEIVISNSLIIWGPREKDVRIHQRLYLKYGAVMALPTPWNG